MIPDPMAKKTGQHTSINYTGKLARLSLLFNAIFILFFIGKRIYYSVPQKQVVTFTEQNTWNKSRLSVFSELPIDSNAIVFIGNSITEGFPLNEMFPDLPVKNRGIATNRSWHILQRIDSILKYKPRKIFLEMGINDLGDIPITADSVLANYKRVINKVKAQSPNSILIVQSCMPTSMIYKDRNHHVIELNKKLYSYCQEQKLQYIDLFTPLAKGGQLDSSFTLDGLHINGKGYQVWKQQIEAFIK